MADYSMLFGGVRQQPVDLVAGYNEGRENAAKMNLYDLQSQGQQLKNQDTQSRLDMSAFQRLSHTAKGLAAIQDDGARNRAYQAVLPHLQKLAPDDQWPQSITQQDAQEFATQMDMLDTGGMTEAQLKALQLQISQGNLAARNKEIEQSSARADRQLGISDKQLSLEREKIDYAKDQDRRQRDALARLAAPVDGENGAVPPPNAPNYADLPTSTLKKLAEQNTDPKVAEERRNNAIAKAGEITKGANTFDLVDSILTDPALDASTGGTGVIYRNLPGTQGKRVDANIKRLQGSTFLQSIQQIKGMGALSNTEGDKIQAAAAALDPQMDSKDFKGELVKFRETVKEGIRNTWVADNPKIPADDIDMLIQRPDLAASFKQMYGTLPKGFDRVKGYLSGPAPQQQQQTGGQVKFLGFE